MTDVAAERTEARRTYERERARRIRAANMAKGLTSMGTPRVGQSKVRLDPAEKRRRRIERDARRWREVGRYRWVSKATGERIPVELPVPYSGHRWLDMVRDLVTDPPAHLVGTERYERAMDDRGEALLALLEGKDPKAALKAYRSSEYIARFRTTYFGEFREDDEAWRLDRIVPTVPSAEDEAVANETVRELAVLDKVSYHGGTGKALMGRSRQGTPSNRRSNHR